MEEDQALVDQLYRTLYSSSARQQQRPANAAPRARRPESSVASSGGDARQYRGAPRSAHRSDNNATGHAQRDVRGNTRGHTGRGGRNGSEGRGPRPPSAPTAAVPPPQQSQDSTNRNLQQARMQQRNGGTSRMRSLHRSDSSTSTSTQRTSKPVSSAGNAGSQPPVLINLDDDVAQTPGPTNKTGSTSYDEMLAQLLQQELLGETQDDPFAHRVLGRKELDPDLYSPAISLGNASVTGRSSPTYATYATEDNSLMNAYRDLNQRRGLPDYLTAASNSEREQSTKSDVIAITSDDESDGDITGDSNLPLTKSHGDAALPLLIDDEDDDVIDSLDLSRLNSYSLSALKKYCEVENLPVPGRTKEYFTIQCAQSILAYNDDEEEDEVSVSDLVEQSHSHNSDSDDDIVHNETGTRSRFGISVDSDSYGGERLALSPPRRSYDSRHLDLTMEGGAREASPPTENRWGRAYDGDLDFVSTVTNNPTEYGRPAASLGFGSLSEDEMLALALQESKLEQERYQREQKNKSDIPQPRADLHSDEILARALQEELNSGGADDDEKLARQLQMQLEREDRPSTLPEAHGSIQHDDLMAMLMSLTSEGGGLEDVSAGTSLDIIRNPRRFQSANTSLSTSERRRDNAPVPHQSESPRLSYFQRNFTFAPATAAYAGSAAVSGQRRFRSRVAGQTEVDPDDMSYEELLELAERIGDVKKKGASASTITSSTQTYIYQGGQPNENSTCSVCMEAFEKGDEVRMLPCIHAYHKACIDQWLTKKAVCPVCQRPITGAE